MKIHPSGRKYSKVFDLHSTLGIGMDDITWHNSKFKRIFSIESLETCDLIFLIWASDDFLGSSHCMYSNNLYVLKLFISDFQDFKTNREMDFHSRVRTSLSKPFVRLAQSSNSKKFKFKPYGRSI